ncbi:MAG: choice-of-anchor K domain-containing protein [Planctomycetota bacterium]
MPGFLPPSSGNFTVQNGGLEVPLSFIQYGNSSSGDLSNQLIVSGLPFSVQLEEPFVVANAAYYNGVTQGGNPNNINLTIDLFLDGLLDGPVGFDFPLGLTITSNNSSDPLENADTLTVSDAAQTEFFRVDSTNYQLELLGFQPAGETDFEDRFVLLEDTASFANVIGRIRFADIPPLIGDFNASGSVEQADLDLVLTNWGGTRSFEDDVTVFSTPNVDQEELDIVLTNWGSSVSPSFAANPNLVPEPGIFGLLGAGLGVMLRRRRAA